MKIKQKIITLAFALIALFGVMTIAAPGAQADCGGAKTSILNCSQGKNAKNAQDTGVWGLIIIALNIMTAGVGVLAVGGMVYASILYASSSDNAEQTKHAKQVIKNIAIGIIAYAGMYLMLNFLIPGGIFS
jgi:heme/copper-type cytochrome/quinol oxidase subunit 2